MGSGNPKLIFPICEDLMDTYVTPREFELFHDDINDRLSRVERKIDEGFSNLNGRTRTQAEAIVALDT